MLDLFRDAGCSTLIIGFESVTEASLAAMDKPVNFCLTYQEAIDRIHARGMTIIGNFIVGFDTDTLGVFKQTLDFIQKTGILYPFFSILTPMPGTKLFDEYKAAGRLDHENWHLYDTRHVVFEPKHMRRDELMDGYVWLYEQAYGTDRCSTSASSGTGGAARRARTSSRRASSPHASPSRWCKGDAELRRHFKDGIKLMMGRGINARRGPAPLPARRLRLRALHAPVLDVAKRGELPHVRGPASLGASEAARTKLDVMQWQNTKAVKRTEGRAAGRSLKSETRAFTGASEPRRVAMGDVMGFLGIRRAPRSSDLRALRPLRGSCESLVSLREGARYTPSTLVTSPDDLTEQLASGSATAGPPRASSPCGTEALSCTTSRRTGAS